MKKSTFVMCLIGCFLVVSQAAHAQILFQEDFEPGWGDWYVDNGVWEIGTPSAGPAACHGGTMCAGTVLAGNYPANTDSRLIYPLAHLPGLQLPAVTGHEELRLRFWHWVSYSSGEIGYVQVSYQDPVTEIWSDFETVPGSINITSTITEWTWRDLDLTPYAGLEVRLAFYHTAARNTFNDPSESTGWYVDDIQITKKVPQFTGDFEGGWGDWTADDGIWGVGTPTAGPAACSDGDQCAGTNVDGNYQAYRDSRLILPSVHLAQNSTDEIVLSFEQWWSYSSADSGYLQISVLDEGTGNWSAWETIPDTTISGVSTVWTPKYVTLTAYAETKVRIGFYHTAARNVFNDPSESTGWYIDEVEIFGITIDCVDSDGDGYGNPGSSVCTYPEPDCDDSDPDVNPGAVEMPPGDPTCGDGLDNDCDLLTDLDDPGCQVCIDNDEDGYGDPANPVCTHPQLDCDDGDPNVNPGATEDEGAGNCADGKDNDCDGLTDNDPGCPGGTCGATAEASAFGTSPVHDGWDAMRHLSYLMVPVGLLVLLRFRRKKK